METVESKIKERLEIQDKITKLKTEIHTKSKELIESENELKWINFQLRTHDNKLKPD